MFCISKIVFYICLNVTMMGVSSIGTSKNSIPSVWENYNRSHEARYTLVSGFTHCRQGVSIQFYPPVVARLLNNTEVAFVSLTDKVSALFQLTSEDLQDQRKPYSTARREWKTDNRQLTKKQMAEKVSTNFSSYFTYFQVGVLQGLKVLLIKN